MRKFSCGLLYLAICLSSLFLVGAMPTDSQEASEPEQIRVPLSAEISYDIAGAQFKFSYTDGLVFVGYEKSPAVDAGSSIPEVEKDGFTYRGFYSGSNIFAPQNGSLDMGYLVFEKTGEGAQTVTISEIKLVELIDNETTRDVIIGPLTIAIPQEDTNDLGEGLTDSDRIPADTYEESSGSGGIPTDTDEDSADTDENRGFPWAITTVILLLVVAAALFIKGRGESNKNRK